MYCRKCGHQINAGESFCRECGESVPVVRRAEKASGGKKGWLPMGIIAAALAVILILQNLSVLPLMINKGNGSKYGREIGYATPEETISKFAEAIADNDTDGALALFACRHITDHYDYAAYIERMGAWQPNARYVYPAPEGIFRESTYAMLRGDAAKQIFNLCFSLKADSEYLEMTPIMAEEMSQVIPDLEEFTELERLNTFRVVRMDYTKPEIQNTLQTREVYKKAAKTYGAEDSIEYSILYEYGGQTYFGGMTLIQYGEKWYIQSLIGALAGQTSFAYLEPMSEARYCEIVEV